MSKEKIFDESKVICLSCTECGRKLMNLLPVHHEGNEQKFQAKCYSCEGFSQIETIKGIVYTGPIGEEDLSRQTIIEDVTLDENKALFIIKASNE